MKIILWILFISLLVIVQFQGSILLRSGEGIIDLELADPIKGLTILQSWAKMYYGDTTLLKVALTQTKWDFAFIFSYVVLIISMSNWQMQREKVFVINELLRFNLFAITIAGVSDVVENICMLHNFHHVFDSDSYWSSQFPAALKFILAGISIAIFLLSWIKSTLFNKTLLL